MTRILFIDSVEKQCGVNSYGERTFHILCKSKKYKFHRCIPTSMWEYELFINIYKPSGVIINYHPSTLPWFSGDRHCPYKQYILFHEGSKPANLHPDLWLNVDSLMEETWDSFSVPRPLVQPVKKYTKLSNRLLIGSFGFSFGNKGYGRIVKMVTEQFEDALIRLHMPRAYYGDRDGEARAGVIPGCFNEVKKPLVKLEISDSWLDDDTLLNWLSNNDLNIFLYDKMEGRGLSSVIDYALSVDVPLAINDSDMFRHIQKPEINVANKSLQEIINQGTAPLQEFKDLWSNENFLAKYEHILNTTL